MKAQELRIGNWFKFGELEHTATHWDIRNISINELKSRTSDTYQPIPLTEEWLVKFGFEWSIFHQAFHKDGFEFDLNQLHEGWFELSTFKRVVILTENIKYVHQLQNLYFALTGQELTLTK